MRKFLAWILIPFMLSTSAMAGPPEDGEERTPIIDIALFLARAFITYRFTSIMAPDPNGQEEIILNQDPPKDLSEIPLNEEEALSALGISSLLAPTGVFTIRTKGFFTKRFEWKIKTRFLGEVVGVHIHCKPLLIGKSQIGVTLTNEKRRADPTNWREVSGHFSEPDIDNKCGWKDYNDVLMAMFLGKAFIQIHTVDNPEGALKGDIVNIGVNSD